MVGTWASRTTASISPAPPRGIDDVDQAAGLDQMGDAGAVLAGQQLHGVGVEVLGRQRGAQRGDQRRVGPRRRRAAAQQHRVARLQRQPERVDGHVGPALVDDADHAERNPLLAQLQAVGQRAARAAPHRSGRAGRRPGAARRRCRRCAAGFSASRSSIASGVPAARGGSRSAALAARIVRASRQHASAAACSARFLVSVLSVASSRAATRARRAASWTCWRKSWRVGACRLISPAYRTCAAALAGSSGRSLSTVPARPRLGTSVGAHGGAGLRSGQCQRRSHFHRRRAAAARPDRSRVVAVVGAGRQGRQSGGRRRPRRRRGAARRGARHRLRPPTSCAPTCTPTRSDSTAWSRCPGPAVRRRSSSTPRPRTPSWSRRAPTHT